MKVYHRNPFINKLLLKVKPFGVKIIITVERQDSALWAGHGKKEQYNVINMIVNGAT
jgi:hypothetical protein